MPSHVATNAYKWPAVAEHMLLLLTRKLNWLQHLTMMAQKKLINIWCHFDLIGSVSFNTSTFMIRNQSF